MSQRHLERKGIKHETSVSRADVHVHMRTREICNRCSSPHSRRMWLNPAQCRSSYMCGTSHALDTIKHHQTRVEDAYPRRFHLPGTRVETRNKIEETHYVGFVHRTGASAGRSNGCSMTAMESPDLEQTRTSQRQTTHVFCQCHYVNDRPSGAIRNLTSIGRQAQLTCKKQLHHNRQKMEWQLVRIHEQKNVIPTHT